MMVNILLLAALSLFIGILGRHRKLGFWGYFFASMLLTPLIGILLLIASDAKYTHEKKKLKKT